MTVGEKIAFDDFYNDPRFTAKKPGPDNIRGDNFFSKDLKGEYNIAAHAIHAGDALRIRRDLRTPLAVVADRYWYFGANAPTLPADLQQTRIVQGNVRGHRIITDRAVITRFQQWLNDNHKPGVHGTPRDLRP